MLSAGGIRCPAFTMPNCRIPGDIIVNILSRLPVKSFLRFRSVSKPWLNLISNPNFISTHFNRAIANSGEASLIVHTNSIYSHDVGMTLIRVNLTEIPSVVPPIDFPFPNINDNTVVVGSCNGIICLSLPPLGFEFVLWNPAIRMWKGISSPPLDDDEDIGFGIATQSLGYDPVAFDFKIVRFELCTVVDGVEMYSAKAEIWRYIEIDFEFILQNYGCKAIVQGNPYWVVDVKEVGDDDSEFCEMLVKFVDLKDSLALMVYPPEDGPNKMVDVYVLDEDLSCWSKNFSIGPILETISWVEQYLSNGRIMCINFGNFILYYPETGNIETLLIDDIAGAVNFTESLAFIKGMEQVGKEDKDVNFDN